MNCIRNCLLVLLTVLACAVHAQNPDDQFVKIYTLLLQADQLNDSGQTEQAYDKYLEVQKGLLQLQRGNPNWQPKVIKFRLGYVADKITPLAIKYKDRPAAPAQPSLVEATAKAASNAEVLQLEGRVRDLAEEVDRLRAEKRILEAKLKEALAPQPPPAGQAQLLNAEERIRALTKELDVLKINLDQEKQKQAAGNSAQAAGEKALTEANRKLTAQADAITALSRDRDQLIEQLRRNSKPATAEPRALGTENDKLKQEIADLKTADAKKPSAADAAALRKELRAIEARLKEQLSQNAVLITEKRALQNRVDQLSGDFERFKKETEEKSRKAAAAQKPSGDREAESLRQDKSKLERQVASLTSELADARKEQTRAAKEAASQPKAPTRRELERLKNQLAAAQAQVAAYETKKIPFTPEELALFQKPQPVPARQARSTAGGKRSIKELPGAAGQLVADAQSAFSARRFDEAESKYQEVLRFDLENVYTLANLSLVQMEQGHLDKAELNLTKALDIEPQDAYSLSLLGILKFRQSKLDESLELLSKSVQIDAKNAETQNYLGVVLSQKGMRGPAEAAMRKAIQINPGYAEAHHNLAVIYVSQTPPFVELARWHYDKAIAAGHPKNPSLEKYFEKKSGGAE